MLNDKNHADKFYRHTPYYVKVLKEELARSQAKNKLYSLRAFANKLDMAPGLLSNILNEKRTLSFEKASQIIKIIKLSKEDEYLFLKSVIYNNKTIDKISKKIKKQKVIFLEDNKLGKTIMLHWEHYAFLSLLKIKPHSIEELSKRFSLDRVRGEWVIQNLLAAELIIEKNGKFLHGDFYDVVFDTSSTSKTLVEVRKEVAQLTSQFAQKNPDQYYSTSRTLSFTKKNNELVKNLFDEFMTKIEALSFESPDNDDAYKIVFSSFPLSSRN